MLKKLSIALLAAAFALPTLTIAQEKPETKTEQKTAKKKTKKPPKKKASKKAEQPKAQ